MAIPTSETADGVRGLVEVEHPCSWNPLPEAEPLGTTARVAPAPWRPLASGPASAWTPVDADAAEWKATTTGAQDWLYARMTIELEQEGFLNLEGCGAIILDIAA